jgi:hypothetical protein
MREAEESSLLEAVVRERLLKTQQAGKALAGAVVICKVWRPAVALVVSSGVHNRSINPFINPYPAHPYIVKILLNSRQFFKPMVLILSRP